MWWYSEREIDGKGDSDGHKWHWDLDSDMNDKEGSDRTYIGRGILTDKINLS